MTGTPLPEAWQDGTGRPKYLGEIWILRKSTHLAVCTLHGHPFGSEARVTIDEELHRSEVFKAPAPMVDATFEWRRAFEAKGWLPGNPT